MTRRNFILAAAAAPCFRIALPLLTRPRRALKFAVITDLHYGLAPDAHARFETFVEAVKARKGLDFAMQMGDFCYGVPEAAPCVELWHSINLPRLNVLGNHDMDKCDKDHAMAVTGMKSRYSSTKIGDYRFIILDLNHFKKEGKLVSYVNGNYFTDNATHNWADPEQLAWLASELATSAEPVILISHQPLGFAEPGQAVPPEQKQVLDVIVEAKKKNPKGAVVLCMFGHLHVDRLEYYEGIPFYCVNSASYFWSSGMHAYTKPLFAFMTLTEDGHLEVAGVSGEFVKPPPKGSDSVVGRSASLSARNLSLVEAGSTGRERRPTLEPETRNIVH